MRMHVSPEASGMKLGKATWMCEILGFSCFGFLSVSLSFYKTAVSAAIAINAGLIDFRPS